MKLNGFIARRYLFSKKHISLISTLTAISILGVTIGTALLIVVLSIFNGFFDVIKGLLLSHDPDIRIESAVEQSFDWSPEQQQMLEGIPEIQITVPYIEGKVLMATDSEEQQVITVKGVDEEKLRSLHDYEENITAGNLDLGVRNGMPGVFIPEQIMGDLHLDPEDEVVLLSATGMRKSLTQFSAPRTYRFDVRGGYRIQQVAGDYVVYIEEEAARRLFEYRTRISGLDIRLDETDRADRVREEIAAAIGPDYEISTWYDLQKPMYDVMYLEKWGSYLILMIIVLVAVLNIVGSLTMIVIQKKRDIGVLMTLGYTPKAIRQIFMRQGLYIGLIGCGIGGSIGLLLSWLQRDYGLVKLSSAFILEAYPAAINSFDVSLVLAGSLFLCLAASWYPARRAAEVDPAQAVRYE